MHQKCSDYALINLFSLCKSVWIIELLVVHLNLISEPQHTHAPPKCCELKSAPQLLFFSLSSPLDLQLSQKLGGALLLFHYSLFCSSLLHCFFLCCFLISLCLPHFIMGCFPISLFHYYLFHCTYASMFPRHHFKYLFNLSLLFCSFTPSYFLCPN
jgi:hypothetical protein